MCAERSFFIRKSILKSWEQDESKMRLPWHLKKNTAYAIVKVGEK